MNASFKDHIAEYLRENLEINVVCNSEHERDSQYVSVTVEVSLGNEVITRDTDSCPIYTD